MGRASKLLLIAALGLAAVGAYAAWRDFDSRAALAARPAERHPQTTWTACNRHARDGGPSTFRPLSDAAAASLVTRVPESRRYNARAYRLGATSHASLNAYVPDDAQLARFRSSRVSDGRTVLEFNPYFRYVDGQDGISRPSTDDLIQWAAHKWGIPEDWLRAQYVVESYWNGFELGDEVAVSPAWYRRYPVQARVPGGHEVYESMGLAEVKWIADNSVGAGTEPLRWESTAFDIDYEAAMVRLYFDNPDGARSSWPDRTYAPCQTWNSIGGWFEPYPWRNGGQETYIAKVKRVLGERVWLGHDFVAWSPSSFPPEVAFR